MKKDIKNNLLKIHVAQKLVQDKFVKKGNIITITCESTEEADSLYFNLIQKEALRFPDGGNDRY